MDNSVSVGTARKILANSLCQLPFIPSWNTVESLAETPDTLEFTAMTQDLAQRLGCIKHKSRNIFQVAVHD